MEVIISIIIPTKNASSTIIRTLESISRQSFSNFEVINVDCSDDKTDEIVKEYSLKIDKRVKCIHSNVVGLAKQRNYGVELSRGKYITFVDGDDAIEPDYLETLYVNIIKYNANIVCSNFLKIDGQTFKKINLINSTKSICCNNIEACKLLETTKNTQLTLCQGKLFTRSFALQNPVNEEVLNEDEATSYSWYLKSKKIVILDKQLYDYFVMPNSLSSMHNKKLENKIPPLCKSYLDRYNLYKKTNDKTLIFLGWKRLMDFSLQYSFIFKKEHKNELKIATRKYYGDNIIFHYFFTHPIFSLKMLAKYVRCR